MSKIDQGIESVEVIEDKLIELMRRLGEVDADANLRLERLFRRFRIETATEKGSLRIPRRA